MADPKKMSNYAARLVPTIREKAERICEAEGISLNQFLNLALMRQVTLFEQHTQRNLSRRFSRAEAASVLETFLDRDGSEVAQAGDELPADYRSVRFRGKKKN